MKEEGKKTFFATRKRIDAALAASDKVLKDKEKQYVAAVKKMDTVIDKFDIAREKGGKAVRARVLRPASCVLRLACCVRFWCWLAGWLLPYYNSRERLRYPSTLDVHRRTL